MPEPHKLVFFSIDATDWAMPTWASLPFDQDTNLAMATQSSQTF